MKDKDNRSRTLILMEKEHCLVDQPHTAICGHSRRFSTLNALHQDGGLDDVD